MTTTADITLQKVLDRANPNDIADALRKVQLGHMLAPVKVVVTGLSAASAIDITAAATLAAATVSGLSLATGENLPAIGLVRTLRVTASGTASTVGTYGVTDAGGTAVTASTSTVMGIALLSDDGKTLTFPTTITGFELTYMPRSATDVSAVFENGV